MRPEHERTLWELTRGQRLRYAAAIAAMALGIGFLFGVPLVIKAAIDGIEDANLWLAAAAIIGLTAAGGAFHYLRGRWAAIASEAIVRGLRDRLHGHLEQLPCRYHDRADTGDLVQRCTSDVETVRVFLSTQVVEIARVTLMLATVIPLLFWLDKRMALVSLALLPVIFLFAVLFFRRVKGAFLRVDEAEGRLTAVLQENLTGIRVVRAFARQEHETAKFAAVNGRFRDLNYRLLRLLGNYWSLSDLLSLSQTALVLFLGAYWLRAGTLSVGTMVAFIFYEGMVIWPVRHLGRVLADTGKAVVALGRLREVLAEPVESADETADAELAGGIRVEDLRFAYRPGETVLDGITFRVEPGETLALLGRPGAGKSTLIQLLLRLYDYEEGSIRLDGVELRTLPRRRVRAQIGAVLQEPFLYSRTIGANVRLARRDATDEEMVEAASAASVHHAIEGFEDGYETLVGEKGVTLSGGQRQRVALARALLKDPPILVLDDALSAVDTHTEADILNALRDRRGRRTTLVIAHRLSTVVHADKILLLEGGRVAQAGAHADLLRADGPYRRLWQIQGALEDELGDDLAVAERER